MSDTVVEDDLAVVGRASRAAPRTLEQTLRAVGAVVAGTPAAPPSVALLVTMQRIFALRVARIVVGALALVFVVVRLGSVMLPEVEDGFWQRWLWWYPGSLPRVLAGLAIAYVVTANLAASRFRREVSAAPEPGVRGRALVGAVDTPSLVMAIAGASALAIAEAARFALLHGQSLRWLRAIEGLDWGAREAVAHAAPLAALVIACWISAGLVARRDRRVPVWLVGALPLALISLVLVEGMSEAPLSPVDRPDISLVAFLVFTASAAALHVGLVALAVYRRDRETAALRPEERA